MGYYECKKEYCGWVGQADLQSSGYHVKAICPKCKNYIKFIKQDMMDFDDHRKLIEWQREQTGMENYYIMGLYRDGTILPAGEVTVRVDEMPLEIEINGVIWVPKGGR